MEPEGSLPHSQASAARPSPGLAQSSPHAHNPPPGDWLLGIAFRIAELRVMRSGLLAAGSRGKELKIKAEFKDLRQT